MEVDTKNNYKNSVKLTENKGNKDTEMCSTMEIEKTYWCHQECVRAPFRREFLEMPLEIKYVNYLCNTLITSQQALFI